MFDHIHIKVSFLKGSCYLVPSRHELRNIKLEIFHKKEQKFDFKKLNKVEWTSFKIIISILNSLTYTFKANVNIKLS